MTPTRDSILGDFQSDIALYEATTPRAQQRTTGASQIYGCTAEAMFRLRGEQGDARLSWPAVVGKAIHEYAAVARAKVRDGVICEQRFAYKNVPASVDYLEPAQHLLVDLKSKDDVDDIEALLTAGPSITQMAQLHLGAAAAREAGYDIRYVALLILPRSGELDEAEVLGPWEFDQQQADDAAAWGANVDELAADDCKDPRDFRGKPAFWCFAFCEFARTCRGPHTVLDIDLAELAVPAEAYATARDTRDDAIGTMRQLRPMLLGNKGRAGRVTISTSSGYVKDELVEDVDALRDTYRFVHGADAELPMRQIEKKVSPSLRVTWAKERS